ncbi:hypothetical protein ARTHRO9V_280073 [Arthrobacter sp. 9V]|nr:hypothetical protein ARTHRO9V_280073 [Arthrobacter sp. 9V]
MPCAESGECPPRDRKKLPACPDCKDILENVIESNVPGGN